MAGLPAAVEIRAAAPADLAAVARIYAPYVTGTTVTFELTPPTVDDWRARFGHATERGLPFLVAEARGAVVGFAYCTPWRTRPAYRHTAEDSVYVDASATGVGVGRALLERLLDRCAAGGVREVVAVVVDDGQPASLALHRRCGFTEAGRLGGVGHKHGRWLDTVLLQRSLRP